MVGMILLMVVSLPSAGPARMQEALVPRSKPTRIFRRSPGRRGGAASAGRSRIAVAERSVVVTDFFSVVVVVVIFRGGSGLAVGGRRRAAAGALGRQHGVEQIGNGRRPRGRRRGGNRRGFAAGAAG